MEARRQVSVIDPRQGVARPEVVAAWLERANAGDRLIYACVPFLPHRSQSAARLRQLAACGHVYLTQPRSAINGSLFDYTAERSTKPLANAKPRQSVLKPRLVDAEAAVIDALLPVLQRFAGAGRPCPTNHQLAKRSGLPCEIIPEAMAALRAAGLIHVQAAPAPTLRRVMILASGAMTGLAA